MQGRVLRSPLPSYLFEMDTLPTEGLKLHLGCGGNRMDGWVNVDTAGADVNADLTRPWPFTDESAKFLFTEHMLEHMTPIEAESCLCEAYRVLRKNGIIRIALPCVSHICTLVADGRWRDQAWLQWPQFSHIKTAAEMMNTVWYDWGHKWMYDHEELERRLRNSGFENIWFGNRNYSKHPELCGLESREDSLLIAEATK